MKVHEYYFPASGWIREKEYEETFKRNLNDSPDCLMSYAIFPSDGDILKSAEIMADANGQVNGVILHTYSKMWENNEDELKSCVEECLKSAADEHELSKAPVKLEEPVKYHGLTGDIPNTLYHIADEKSAESILKTGLYPQIGHNNYKSQEDRIYLMEKTDIPAWLAILPHLEKPVILEVNTDGLEDLQSGRHFSDRSFTKPDGYGEYFTTDYIPPANIREMPFTEEYKKELTGSIKKQINDADNSDKKEAIRGAERLASMGICKIQDLVSKREEAPKQDADKPSANIPSFDDEDKPPWDEEDSAKKETVTIKSPVRDSYREKQFQNFMDMQENDLCEMIQAHFRTHPTLPGEKALKNMADQMLDTGISDTNRKEFLAKKFADTRIRETPLTGHMNLDKIKSEAVDETITKHKQDGSPAETTIVSASDIELRKMGENIHALVNDGLGGMVPIGRLPEKFLKNNPMNVSACSAKLQLIDYSNGKGKNVSYRVVVDTDIMSGDVVELNDEILYALEHELQIEQ